MWQEWEEEKACYVLVGESEGYRQRRRFRRRFEDNIKMELKQI
jgi:hypothetical protein